MFMTASFWFGGFNVGPQALEEKAPGTRLSRIGVMIVASIVVGIVFKVLVILAASMSTPWRELTQAPVPVAAAFERAFGSVTLARLVLVTALCGLLGTWNSVLLAAARTLYALGRAGYIAPVFGGVRGEYGSPGFAVLFAGGVAALATLLGRNAIEPIVDAAASCLAVAYLLTCLALIRLRRTAPTMPRPFRVPGGVATARAASVGAAFSLALSIYEPYAAAAGHIPLEWLLLGGWLAVGLTFWTAARAARRRIPDALRRQIISGRAYES